MQTVFRLLATLISIYLLICIIYIMMSWFPGAKFTKFGKFLSRICEPYLHIFSKSRKFTLKNIDFSPLIALGILSFFSILFSKISATGILSLSDVVVILLAVIWDIIKAIIIFIGVASFIRWIIVTVDSQTANPYSAWNQLDLFLGAICYRMARIFTRKTIPYKKALLITWVECIILYIITKIVFFLLIYLSQSIPI